MSNGVIVDGLAALEGLASATAQIIVNLERENADLRLQLERGVQLREELQKALADWHHWMVEIRPEGIPANRPVEARERGLQWAYENIVGGKMLTGDGQLQLRESV
jgi:hypothetical protein